VRSTDQLLELVRFLRREKEIAISRSEVQEAETQRLKTQLEQAERLANESQVNKLLTLKESKLMTFHDLT
jgi:nucleoprotein TPR